MRCRRGVGFRRVRGVGARCRRCDAAGDGGREWGCGVGDPQQNAAKRWDPGRARRYGKRSRGSGQHREIWAERKERSKEEKGRKERREGRPDIISADQICVWE